jgi:hypothetical protein
MHAMLYYGRMNKTPAKTKPADAGYINIRITKKAYRELARRAVADRRTIIAQLDVLLGI